MIVLLSCSGRFNMTTVGSTPSGPAPMSGLDSLRKISTHTLPPAYSDLEVNQLNGKSNGSVPVLRYISRVPEDPEEPDYANLPSTGNGQQDPQGSQSFKEPFPLPSSQPELPPKGRRASLGAPGGRRPSLGLPTQNDAYPGRLSPSERARSHNVISVSPDSEESGSPKEIDQSDHGYPKNGRVSQQQQPPPPPQQQQQQLQQQSGLSISREWYRSSTPSLSHNGADGPGSLLPPLSPTSHTSGGSSTGGFPIQSQAPPSTSASHKSLQFSYSNPSSFQKNFRSQSSMGQTSVANGGPRVGNGMSAKSSHNVGRYTPRSSSSMGRNNLSVPAAMDQYIDKITDV